MAGIRKDFTVQRYRSIVSCLHVRITKARSNGDLPAPLSLQTELHCWKHKWFHVKTDNLPDSPIGALNKWDSRLFPNIEN